MKSFLVVSIIGPYRRNLVAACAKTVADAGCNINDSRMAVLGSDLSMFMLLAGSWDSIAKIEGALSRLEEQFDLNITCKRTETRQPSSDMMPYAVEVVSIDHPGIVKDIAEFFSLREIAIEDMYTSTYNAAHTGTPMFSLHMTVSVPIHNSIAALRGEFMDFCDQLNLDSIMEPVK